MTRLRDTLQAEKFRNFPTEDYHFTHINNFGQRLALITKNKITA